MYLLCLFFAPSPPYPPFPKVFKGFGGVSREFFLSFFLYHSLTNGWVVLLTMEEDNFLSSLDRTN